MNPLKYKKNMAFLKNNHKKMQISTR